MSNASDPGQRPLAFSQIESVAPPSVKPAHTLVAGRRLIVDLLLLGVWIAATDWLLYHVGTFLAWSLFLGGATLFLASATYGINRQKAVHRPAMLATGLLLGLLSLKLLWCGSWLQVVCGAFVLLCYSMALSGSPPFLPEVIGFFGVVMTGAVRRLRCFRLGRVNQETGTVKPMLAAHYVIPLAVLLAFGILFVLANPNLSTAFATTLRRAWDISLAWIDRFEPVEVLFWFVSGWLLLGLLYPSSSRSMKESPPDGLSGPRRVAPLVLAYRNSLLSLIALFAIYLVFEFSTLWFQTFPADFYYAGYAHEGAFWLTAALGLATLVLSVVFRNSTLRDERVGMLKRLALIWSVENFLLTLAVYNRLFIYIDFNGMTRMRVVGLLGTACVAVGFGLVVYKLMRDRGFVWLVHRQLWVPVAATIVYAVLPVDWLVHRYNVDRVLAGSLAPSVQIVAHPSTAEGMLPVVGLINSQDEVIRNGARALLAVWAQELGVGTRGLSPLQGVDVANTVGVWQSSLGHRSPWMAVETGFSQHDRIADADWMNFQAAEARLRQRLIETRSAWSEFDRSLDSRRAALDAYFRYAYQWY